MKICLFLLITLVLCSSTRLSLYILSQKCVITMSIIFLSQSRARETMDSGKALNCS